VHITEGTVVAIRPHGFRLATSWESEVDCHTMTLGRELALAIGDRVRVRGGRAPDGGVATSSIHRASDDGTEEPVFDRPRSGWCRRLMRAALRRR
jgi:hypothetical protein